MSRATLKGMMMIPCIIQKVTTLADKTVRIIIDSNEIRSENMTILFEMWKSGWHGVIAFKDGEFSEIDKAILDKIKLDDMEFGTKSQSERLRNVLWVLYNKQSKDPTEEGFRTYYRGEMNRAINHFKSRINEID